MADTKIPNTCTVCHHLMQQVTSWRGESETVNHLFSTFIFFFSPSAKKKRKETQREQAEGNASVAMPGVCSSSEDTECK